jgi:hypothetical protein
MHSARIISGNRDEIQTAQGKKKRHLIQLQNSSNPVQTLTTPVELI